MDVFEAASRQCQQTGLLLLFFFLLVFCLSLHPSLLCLPASHSYVTNFPGSGRQTACRARAFTSLPPVAFDLPLPVPFPFALFLKPFLAQAPAAPAAQDPSQDRASAFLFPASQSEASASACPLRPCLAQGRAAGRGRALVRIPGFPASSRRAALGAGARCEQIMPTVPALLSTLPACPFCHVGHPSWPSTQVNPSSEIEKPARRLCFDMLLLYGIVKATRAGRESRVQASVSL